MENAIGQDSRTITSNEGGDLYEPTKQDEIERLYNIFTRRRIGGVYPRKLADYFENHSITLFGSKRFVKDFTAVLRASFMLTEVIRDTSLAINPDDNEIDMEDLLSHPPPTTPKEEEEKEKEKEKGGVEGGEGEEVGGDTWEDLLIRQMTAIVMLWRRIDRALLGLAHQHLSTNTNNKNELSSRTTTITTTGTHHQSSLPLNSADGMGVIKDSLFATHLLEFLESLNLFPGDGTFIEQMVDWFELTESILEKIHNAIERREEEKLLFREEENRMRIIREMEGTHSVRKE